MKKALGLICILALIFGVTIIILSSNLSKPLGKDELVTVVGLFDHYEEGNGRYSVDQIYFQDGTSYAIQSTVFRSFNQDEFLQNVSKGNEIVLMVDKKTNPKYNDIYYVKSNDVVYMSFEDSYDNSKTNQFVGYVLGGVFIFVSIVFFIGYCSNGYRQRK